MRIGRGKAKKTEITPYQTQLGTERMAIARMGYRSPGSPRLEREKESVCVCLCVRWEVTRTESCVPLTSTYL
jgi:hypothetical protein